VDSGRPTAFPPRPARPPSRSESPSGSSGLLPRGHWVWHPWRAFWRACHSVRAHAASPGARVRSPHAPSPPLHLRIGKDPWFELSRAFGAARLLRTGNGINHRALRAIETPTPGDRCAMDCPKVVAWPKAPIPLGAPVAERVRRAGSCCQGLIADLAPAPTLVCLRPRFTGLSAGLPARTAAPVRPTLPAAWDPSPSRPA
jgi:hypothetical protein